MANGRRGKQAPVGVFAVRACPYLKFRINRICFLVAQTKGVSRQLSCADPFEFRRQMFMNEKLSEDDGNYESDGIRQNTRLVEKTNGKIAALSKRRVADDYCLPAIIRNGTMIPGKKVLADEFLASWFQIYADFFRGEQVIKNTVADTWFYEEQVAGILPRDFFENGGQMLPA